MVPDRAAVAHELLRDQQRLCGRRDRRTARLGGGVSRHCVSVPSAGRQTSYTRLRRTPSLYAHTTRRKTAAQAVLLILDTGS